MNLIFDPWIKVISKDGYQLITPAELVHSHYLDVYLPRPDFKGALYQFLIGLLQTCFAPEDTEEWVERWRQPPASNSLLEAFSKYKVAFELINKDGPAFMQDFCLENGEQTNISALLIDSPGESTIKQDRDLFVKRNRVKSLCMPCAALALFTLQINAPSGGQGHRVGLRGGGPLTTLLVPTEEEANLWRKLWLNVIPLSGTTIFKKTSLNESKYIFPWLAPTPISDKGITIIPEDMHPLHMYWSMPRRIRLEIENLTEGACDLCGDKTTTLISNCFTKNYGINYDGAWMHPLTPYRIINTKEISPPLSVKGQTGGIGYRHWLGLCLGTKTEKKEEHPALAVLCYQGQKDELNEATHDYLLWCFGYDMDNMKARCWYENKLPLFQMKNLIKENSLEEIKDNIAQLVNIAYEMSRLTKKYLKQVWCEHAEGKVDFLFIDKIFWESSEKDFYECLEKILDQKEEFYRILESWLVKIKLFSLSIFDQQTLAAPSEDLDLKKTIKARNELSKWLSCSKPMSEKWQIIKAKKKSVNKIKEVV